MRMPLKAAVLAPLMLLALGCAPQASSTATDSTSTDAAQTAADCAQGKTLTDGVLTVGTDSPAFEPWFKGNDPTNGKGFESAVAYEVAKRMGFEPSAVTWTKVPFNSSYAPGPKKFDFDINQISITPSRAKVVDFSDGYYTASQGLIALKDSPAAQATSVDDLKDLKLGAQTGTTSLTAIREDVQPTTEPLVFQSTNAAKQALLNGQVDAIVADLPTAFIITAVQIPSATSRRAVPAADRQPRGVRDALREGQPAGRLRQPGAGDHEERRQSGRAREEVAQPDRERARPPVTRS